MITFNNIVERFEIFAENHFFIKSFSFGSPDDVDLSKFEEFPLMHLVYTGATYDAGMKTYNLEVYILDVPHDKKGKVIPQKEAISDSEQCAEDILADIKMGGNIFLFAQDYEVVNATTTPLEEETKNVLSGVLLDLSVAIPYEWDACNAPIDGVAPGGGEVVYARRGVLRMLTLDGATDVQSVRTIKVTNGTLTDDGDGVVTLDTGGVETLEALTDVTITNAANGQVIKYLNGIWINAADGGAISLNDLTDVIISQPSTGEFFRYDGGEWVNDSAQKSDVGLANVDNTSDANKPVSTATQTALDLKADITSVPTELDDLNDVQIIGTPTLGQALVYGAGKWLPGAAGATDLGDLDDVNTTGAAFGSLLTYNGASWDISGSQLPTDDIYFHQRYETESEALRTGATATTELYFTCTAQGNGLAESASSDTPTAGKIIKRKIYYSDEGFADPDTGTWVEFTPAPADDAAFATVKAALLENLKARTGGTVPISLKQTWEEVAAAPTFTGLLNETYGSGAAAAYGTRRLNGNYSGACMTIRRASDGTTQTIGFVGEEIDESAITTFCTGSTCTVQVWHDQSQTGGTGSGNDAEQTTPANQPTIYTGGAIVKDGGRVAFTSTSSTSFSFTQITDINSVFSVLRPTDFTGDSTSFILGDGSNYNYHSGDYRNLGGWLNTQYSAGVVRNGDNYLNGASVDLTTLTRSAGQYVLSMIHTANTAVASQISQDRTMGNRSWVGNRQELIIYSDDRTNQRTDIEGNISAYYQSAKLLDESYGSGAEAAYSVRQLKRDNTECMVIRRASDSTTTTIGFDGSGNIDEAAITTFCTGTSCTVETWKDLSGNGNDATQATPANQPTIYTGGALVKEGGRLTLDFDGADDYLDSSLTVSTTDIAVTSVQKYDDVSGSQLSITISEGTNNGLYTLHNASSGFWRLFYRNVGDSVTANTNQNIISFFADGASSFYYENGTSIGSAFTENVINSTDPVRIGAWSGGGLEADCNVQELIIWQNDKSTDRTNIEENIGDYFTQNTPLLDTYSGAAAAYSLRLLDSTYTGSAIRVRRSSDNTEQDIGFNVFSELDTVSLLDFAGTGDAFVKVWYCQSGNSNDATQTATGSQPQIVSSGVVIVENGKPAVEFDGSNDNLAAASAVVTGAQFFCSNVLTMGTTGQPWGDQGSLGVRAYETSTTSLRVQYNTDNGSFQMTGDNSGSGQRLKSTRLISGTQEIFDNGSLATSATNTFTSLASNNVLRFGMRYNSSTFFDGKLQEFVLYNSDESAKRAGIETNIATFYGITL